ncbi:MAG: DNA mismatch repair endonuclease MutL, partial [Verrucomicrobiota bacterium]
MQNGNVIQVLSDHVANKIAAGEVVDRPASVVKELMENAIDAGATQIEVEVIDGGRKVIVVTDNGKGMSRDDALLAIERHATSKIRDVDDIEAVQTLGFRGEALASIASVSRFSLTTRRPEDLGATEVIINGGRIQDVREAGSPPGTCFKVRNLFFNVPARRKFLRTAQTELSHIRQIFLVYALSYPDKGMTLTVDERELFRLPGGDAMEDRLREIYSPEFCVDLRKLDYVGPGCHLTGFIGSPALHRADRSDQYIFINGRPASAPMLASALKEGFRGLIPKGRHPVVFLFIEMEPSLVDVNVHPTKKEVRFRRPSDLRDALIEGIREAMAQPLSPSATEPEADPETPGPSPPPKPAFQIQDLPEVRTFQYPKLPLEPEQRQTEMPDVTKPEPENEPESPGLWAWCRILGQVGGMYVVLETDEGMVLMDPHAAHERVLFESYMKDVVEAGRCLRTLSMVRPGKVM